MKRQLAAAAFLVLLAAPAARADSSLTLRAVDEVIEHNDRAVQACGRGLDLRRGDAAAVMIVLTIDADGHVADAFAPSRSRTAACLEKVARKIQFPAPGSEIQLNFPFMLVRH